MISSYMISLIYLTLLAECDLTIGYLIDSETLKQIENKIYNKIQTRKVWSDTEKLRTLNTRKLLRNYRMDTKK